MDLRGSEDGFNETDSQSRHSLFLLGRIQNKVQKLWGQNCFVLKKRAGVPADGFSMEGCRSNFHLDFDIQIKFFFIKRRSAIEF